MAEYIDRQKIRDEVCKDCTYRVRADGCVYDVLCDKLLVAFIEAEPAADVVPVAHGKWLDEDFPEKMATVHGMAICSVCGELSHKAEHGYNILSKYCPHCGAKMDG